MRRQRELLTPDPDEALYASPVATPDGRGLVKLANRVAGYTVLGEFLDQWLRGDAG